ncbi:MAG: ArsR family transcriptional regulator, partial [Gammaproteobacteria bacterium]
RSDVDLMVVGEVPFEDVVLAVHSVQERLRREVNPVVMSPHDFTRKRKNKERFVTRVLSEPKLILLGALDES